MGGFQFALTWKDGVLQYSEILSTLGNISTIKSPFQFKIKGLNKKPEKLAGGYRLEFQTVKGEKSLLVKD
ncbi:hypothetical protein [Pedobacter alpinus]|uniref:Uncharacterized protein n=1 Tax=Pedobacter alpinus TaxID=1590643 RepID=A0ABW5TT25_9SPHI